MEAQAQISNTSNVSGKTIQDGSQNEEMINNMKDNEPANVDNDDDAVANDVSDNAVNDMDDGYTNKNDSVVEFETGNGDAREFGDNAAIEITAPSVNESEIDKTESDRVTTAKDIAETPPQVESSNSPSEVSVLRSEDNLFDMIDTSAPNMGTIIEAPSQETCMLKVEEEEEDEQATVVKDKHDILDETHQKAEHVAEEMAEKITIASSKSFELEAPTKPTRLTGQDVKQTLSVPKFSQPPSPDGNKKSGISDENTAVNIDSGNLDEAADVVSLNAIGKFDNKIDGACKSGTSTRYDRLHLLEALRRAFIKREELQKTNNELQTKLAKYFKKKKTDSFAKHESNARDQELRYLKDLDLLEELRSTMVHRTHNYEETIRRMQERCREKIKNVEQDRHGFNKYKQMVAKSAISRRTGAHVSEKELEYYASVEERKESEVSAARLEYIRRKNKLQQQEQQLKLKENLGEGLSLIDFEQLKIENQTYNEKIEERNEELLKLRKKITSTVQVLTHLKEKLQWLQRENQIHGDFLSDKEAAAAEKRDILSRTKKVRDLLRRDNIKLRIEGGLRGSRILLRDFETQRDQLEVIVDKIERQKSRHAELNLNITRIRKKIDKLKGKSFKS